MRHCSLVLELDEFSVDLVNVDVHPAYVVVAVHARQHIVVQLVELLQQVELLAHTLQLGVLGHLAEIPALWLLSLLHGLGCN